MLHLKQIPLYETHALLLPRWKVELSLGLLLLNFSLAGQAPAGVPSRPRSFWNGAGDTSPEITSRPSTPFPCVRIDDFEAIFEPGFLELGNILCCSQEWQCLIRHPSCLVQIHLQRLADGKFREGETGRGRHRGLGTTGNRIWDGWIVLRNEIAPYSLDCFHKFRALIEGWRSEICCNVTCVSTTNHRVLISVRDMVDFAERLGHPVRRANKGRFCVKVLD